MSSWWLACRSHQATRKFGRFPTCWWSSSLCVPRLGKPCSLVPNYRSDEEPDQHSLWVDIVAQWHRTRPSVLWLAKIPAVNCKWLTSRRSSVHWKGCPAAIALGVATPSGPAKRQCQETANFTFSRKLTWNVVRNCCTDRDNEWRHRTADKRTCTRTI